MTNGILSCVHLLSGPVERVTDGDMIRISTSVKPVMGQDSGVAGAGGSAYENGRRTYIFGGSIHQTDATGYIKNAYGAGKQKKF